MKQLHENEKKLCIMALADGPVALADGPAATTHPMISYPPLYTLQPVAETREKQLSIWVKMILEWAESTNTWSVDAGQIPLWENASISRRLSDAGIRSVIARLISTRNAAWEDDKGSDADPKDVAASTAAAPGTVSGRRLRLMWRSPAEVGSELIEFVRKTGMSGGIYTLFELQESFRRMDPWLLREAVKCLEEKGLAVLMGGSSVPDQEGVKFANE